MVYRQQSTTDPMKSAECPECQSKRLMYKGGKLICTNCDHVIGVTANKYGAKRTKARDGISRDSKFEASIADELWTRKAAKDIQDYESQYKVIIPICREDGSKAFEVSHKVDFRIFHLDGSYELYEAKGVETMDYRWRRKLLEEIWLPMHKDHVYTVIRQNVRHR